MATTVRGRAGWIAYLAGVIAITGLMAVVVFGGSAIPAKKIASDAAPQEISAVELD